VSASLSSFSKVKLSRTSFFCTFRFPSVCVLWTYNFVHVELSFVTSFYLFLLLHPHFLEPRPGLSWEKKVMLSPSSFCGSRWRRAFCFLCFFLRFYLLEIRVWILALDLCAIFVARRNAVFMFFVFFWFPLMTQFSWPVECGHGIEHVICLQVSLGFFFLVFCMFLSFCVVLLSCVGPCLFVSCAFCFVFCILFFFVLRLSEAFAACLCVCFCEGLLARAWAATLSLLALVVASSVVSAQMQREIAMWQEY
jgi:hypothetical protein